MQYKKFTFLFYFSLFILCTFLTVAQSDAMNMTGSYSVESYSYTVEDPWDYEMDDAYDGEYDGSYYSDESQVSSNHEVPEGSTLFLLSAGLFLGYLFQRKSILAQTDIARC